MTRKQFIAYLIAALLLGLAPWFSVPAIGQEATTTIILLRHAEKDTLGQDPDLSKAGKNRAESLPKHFRQYRPDAFFATPYKRTRQTLEPWARKRNKEIYAYNLRAQEQFADSLKQLKGQTIVVAGHSNTIPALVNLLIGKETYLPIDERIYYKVWIVTITDGVASVQEQEFGKQ